MVTVSPEAGEALKDLIQDQKLPEDTALRLGVTKEGCEGSGTQFRYQMDLDSKKPTEKDDVYTSEGVRIYVDKDSASQLEDLLLDVRKEFGGYKFLYRNPNAGHSCGCGSTFS